MTSDGSVRQHATFVLLSGGGSRRMGSDKAFLAVGEREMLDRLLEVGRATCSGCVLVVNDPGPYSEALARYGWAGAEAPAAGTPRDPRLFRRGDTRLRLVMDRHPGLGPVAGLEAGLAAAERELCFTAACDLPFLTSGVVLALLRELELHHRDAAEPDLCAVVPVAGGRRQPLAAAYARGTAREAARCVRAGDVRMDDLLARLDVREVAAEELPREGGGDPGRPFVNVNSPAELRAARRRARSADGAS